MSGREIVASTLARIRSTHGVLLVPIAAFTLLDGSLRTAATVVGQGVRGDLKIAALELPVGLLILALTVARWAKWVPAYMGFGALRALMSLCTGTMASFPNRPFPRSQAAVLALGAGLACWLSWPYVHRKPTGYETLGLFCFVVSTLLVFCFTAYPTVLLVTAASGLSILATLRFSLYRGHRGSK